MVVSIFGNKKELGMEKSDLKKLIENHGGESKYNILFKKIYTNFIKKLQKI